MTELSDDLLAEFENGVEPSVGYNRLMRNGRDAMRAKLDAVRAVLQAGPECSDARCYISRAIFEVIGDEGDDEAE